MNKKKHATFKLIKAHIYTLIFILIYSNPHFYKDIILFTCHLTQTTESKIFIEKKYIFKINPRLSATQTSEIKSKIKC